MRLIEGVDLPVEVMEAHATGNLVFFVGAGASMSPPSDLPSFDELARQLGESARIPFTEQFRDKIDTFIGSLPSGPLGFDAHRHAAALLQPDGSEPNDVHRALVRLANSGPAARIVTTNFDNHLSAAALDEGVNVGDCWIGPALPLGRDFRGIVHLHGSLTREHDELVLDDRDFGRAYFGDGWAPRFLQPMFDKHVVLFVGYSLTDTVMRYLTLGLPSETRRYALVSESEAARDDWSRLGVTPIPYPNIDGLHTDLPRVLEKWDHWARMRHAEHRERMRSLIALREPESGDVTGGVAPMISPVDEDYLKSQASTIDGVRAFTSMANAIEWLEWVDRLPEFKALFTLGGDLSDVSLQLASWFADRFVADPAKSPSAMESLMRHGQAMHPTLRRQIAFGVQVLEENDEPAAVRWRTVMATSVHGQPASAALEDLFSLPRGSGSVHTSLVRKAVVPHLRLAPSFPLVGQSGKRWPRAEIGWPLDEQYMSEYVGAWLREQDATIGLSVLESALLEAYGLLAAYNGDTDSGPLEWGRSAIEPHRQDQYSEPIDVIIDGLRDLGVQAAETTAQLHDRWWSFNYALFRRLALHLVAVSNRLTADQKLEWVLSRGLLFELSTKHETFQVLRVAVSEASPRVREALLIAVLAGDSEEWKDEGWPLARRYEVYNLLVWLARADPSWQAVADELERVQAANVDFAPRDNPDFYAWHSSGASREEPVVPVEDLRSQVASDPSEALLLLGESAKDEFPGDDFFRTDFALVKGMAAQAPKEGLDLWWAAGHRDVAEQQRKRVRTALVSGWTTAELGDLGVDVLACVGELASDEASLYTITEFLLTQARKRVEGPDNDFLEASRGLAASMWKAYGGSFQPHADSDPSTLALNTWPGDLVYFWLAQIQRRWRHAGESWNGLDEQECASMESLLDGPPNALKAIWPAIASELIFIHAADSEFAERRVLPLFSSEESLRSTWGSFLYHPRWNLQLLEAGLLDSIVYTFTQIGGLNLGHLERQLLELAASVVSLASVAAHNRGRILDIAVTADHSRHAAGFAESVVRQLKGDVQTARAAWKTWLRSHIAQRITGVPRNAAAEEIARWADVVPYLGDSIPAAVALFQGRGIGLGERFFNPDFHEGFLASHGAALVPHYAERIRNTNLVNPMRGFQIRQLVDELRSALGDVAIQSVVDEATAKGFLRAR